MPHSYLTKERHDELVEELAKLKSDGRKDVADRLKHAKELGDLSENSEYQEAREEQNRLEQRIAHLEHLLRTSAIIKKAGTVQVVGLGTKVKLKKNRDIVSYTIVGSNEAQPAEGLISNESPIGHSLIGKKIGDVLKVKTPKGEIVYEILNIE